MDLTDQIRARARQARPDKAPLLEDLRAVKRCACKYCRRASCAGCILTEMKRRFADHRGLTWADVDRVMSGELDEHGRDTNFWPYLGG